MLGEAFYYTPVPVAPNGISLTRPSGRFFFQCNILVIPETRIRSSYRTHTHTYNHTHTHKPIERSPRAHCGYIKSMTEKMWRPLPFPPSPPCTCSWARAISHRITATYRRFGVGGWRQNFDPSIFHSNTVQWGSGFRSVSAFRRHCWCFLGVTIDLFSFAKQ